MFTVRLILIVYFSDVFQMISFFREVPRVVLDLSLILIFNIGKLIKKNNGGFYFGWQSFKTQAVTGGKNQSWYRNCLESLF